MRCLCVWFLYFFSSCCYITFTPELACMPGSDFASVSLHLSHGLPRWQQNFTLTMRTPPFNIPPRGTQHGHCTVLTSGLLLSP
ncbi:hypothetical protein F5141DRAFT_1112170 [Pisolithus sp. B1]|nr:hypothetical protein F5141DRAFT_1112170 [Pisolithus sp. B1]